MARLAGREVYGAHTVDGTADALLQVFARGLSPLSHPSPPNRFWDALELGRQLEGMASTLDRARQERDTRKGLLDRVTRLEVSQLAAIPIDERPLLRRRSSPAWGWVVGVLVAVVLGAPLLYFMYWQR